MYQIKQAFIQIRHGIIPCLYDNYEDYKDNLYPLVYHRIKEASGQLAY